MIDPLDLRAERLAQAAGSTSDVLVVGGGINGVGIALDAASRGLRTVLVESDDIAVGTSSRSSKLIHGGLRYLEHYQFGLVREALAERDLLATRLAPHLVAIERFVIPVIDRRWEVPYIAAGLTLYDLLGGSRAGRFRKLSTGEAAAAVPSLRTDRVRAAFEYSDGVFDDARFAVTVARTAALLGATVLTRCEVVGWHRSGHGVAGAVVRDGVTGSELTLPARVVVDARGVFARVPASGDRSLQPSRGAHLVVRRDAIPSSRGLTIRVPGRVVFVIPWGSHWLVGTTDVPHPGPVTRPSATADEVEYLIKTLGQALEVDLTPGAIVATYAGVRPLVGEGDDTASISRRESIEPREPGLIAVRGGKYTTYRRIAARTIDATAAALGPLPGSPTHRFPLAGAVPSASLPGLVSEVARVARVDQAAARHLVSRHGSGALEIAMLAKAEGLDSRLVEGSSYLEAEVVWSVRREEALSLDDVLARRTRLAIETPDHALSAAPRVADLMGAELGWDLEARQRAVEEYARTAAAEYAVPGRVRQEVEA